MDWGKYLTTGIISSSSHLPSSNNDNDNKFSYKNELNQSLMDLSISQESVQEMMSHTDNNKPEEHHNEVTSIVINQTDSNHTNNFDSNNNGRKRNRRPSIYPGSTAYEVAQEIGLNYSLEHTHITLTSEEDSDCIGSEDVEIEEVGHRSGSESRYDCNNYRKKVKTKQH